MNNNKKVLNFLLDLSKNNSKEWMDINRDKYIDAKEIWLKEVQKILTMLCKYDNDYFSQFEPKKCISRITNNRMFNPDLPTYKTYFTFSVMDKSDNFSPLHISVGIESSFVGCGYHNPDKKTLKNIREAIDYDGKSFKDIVENKEFKSFFGGLNSFIKPLKTSPRGYAKDHPYVEYLRFKSFVVARDLTQKEITGDDFLDIIEKSYVLTEPFRAYLKKANSI
ncbi:MAG: DUF2461 domain-containing protein [Bacteroidota bacterium]